MGGLFPGKSGRTFAGMSDRSATAWTPAMPDVESVLAQYPDPLRALSEAEIPAILLPRVYPPEQCAGLIGRFIERSLMQDPEEFRPGDRTRVDIGTSLGNRGNDREGFLASSAATHELFSTLFDGFDNPVHLVYEYLQQLGGDKKVMTAREADGRRYGPAIFRVHYESHSYKPHIDHVTLREKRFDYAVTRFRHQFAGVLCLQNATRNEETTQALLHRCLWSEEVQPHIEQETFREYAAANRFQSYRVGLGQGDLYFFNTRCIHEVPPVVGSDPRVVLAMFIGYSPDDPEIFVWS